MLAGMGDLQTKGGGTTKLSDNAMRLKEQLDANAARGGDVTETILRPLLAAIRYGSLPEEEFIALMEYYGSITRRIWHKRGCRHEPTWRLAASKALSSKAAANYMKKLPPGS